VFWLPSSFLRLKGPEHLTTAPTPAPIAAVPIPGIMVVPKEALYQHLKVLLIKTPFFFF
jgi:hypothetical protein